MDNWDNYAQWTWDFVLRFGPRLVGAIIVLIVGIWVVKLLTGLIGRALVKREIDPSLTPFLKALFNGLLKILLVISVLGTLGVEMTSFIAILGSMGLAIGMALSGSLQNFAGGIILLVFKPFKVGDFISDQTNSGTVQEISIMHTVLKDVQNNTVIIPNGTLANNAVINYSSSQTRRVDWVFRVGYGDNADKAKAVLARLITEDDRILKDPEPFTAVQQLADNSVNFVVRVWVESPNFWPVYYGMNEKVYKTFDKEGLGIPYPQMDVHLHHPEKNN